MCGISGIYSKSDNLENTIQQFNKCLANRGPDNASLFVDKKNYFGMGHTRLSILDLSERGNQPMYDHSGEWIISFNGEIYNHLEIRNYLNQKTNENISWKSNSDTETILIANVILGFEKMLEKLEGMFAFALYNKKKNILYLVRDRIGEKPLYYYNNENKFIFGSDISIFKKIDKINLSINYNILSHYIQKGYVPSPYSIYKFIFKLEPGYYLRIENNFSELKKICYWDIKNAININKDSIKFSNNKYNDEKKELKKKLENTVIKQTISDVQVGTFLSGGIDSSLITSILQKNSQTKIKTFTVGFTDKNFDESSKARLISNYLGTDHYEFSFNDNDVMDFVDNLQHIYSEPFADSSQIPTYLISKLMHKEAKVILSGDGGDEFYGGYNRYLYLNLIRFFSKNIPLKIKKNLSLILKFLPINILNKYLTSFNIKNFENKLTKFISFIDTENDIDLYDKVTSLNSRFNYFFTNKIINKKDFFEKKELIEELNSKENFMYLDQIGYLPDDVLCKVDRATMYNSIESRAPFLDHKLVEHSWRIPIEYKIKGNNGKLIVKDILSDYLPNKLISRSKSGFAIPIDSLLRTKLKYWADEIFKNMTKINDEINYENIRIAWEKHKDNKINAGGVLWSVLVLQNWFNQNQK